MVEKKILIPTGMDRIQNVAVSYREVLADEVIGMQVDPSGGTSRKPVQAPAIIYTDRQGNEMIVYNDDLDEPADEANDEADDEEDEEADT